MAERADVNQVATYCEHCGEVAPFARVAQNPMPTDEQIRSRGAFVWTDKSGVKHGLCSKHNAPEIGSKYRLGDAYEVA